MDISVLNKLAIEVLNENGIFYFDSLNDEPLFYDSITFISIIITIENRLGFSISEDLIVKTPQTYNEWIQFISEAIEIHNKETNKQ